MAFVRIKNLALLPMVASLVACASIVGHPTQTIPIASTPSDASVSIIDETGKEVFKGATPTSATLDKSNGQRWGAKSFKVTITKAGFQAQTIPVTASPNGWYIGGNILFGGLIGWLIVDPMNGNMYTLSPESISGTLTAGVAHNNTAHDGSIAVVLIQDVPDDLRDKMVRLN